MHMRCTCAGRNEQLEVNNSHLIGRPDSLSIAVGTWRSDCRWPASVAVMWSVRRHRMRRHRKPCSLYSGCLQRHMTRRFLRSFLDFRMERQKILCLLCLFLFLMDTTKNSRIGSGTHVNDHDQITASKTPLRRWRWKKLRSRQDYGP
jgi:hypothetical protein